MNGDLFDSIGGLPMQHQALAEGVCLLHGHARDAAPWLLDAVQRMALQSPFRQMETPGGLRMSVAMTNCGEVGWSSGPHGYRYTELDALTGQPWPTMPADWRCFARQMAELAGFAAFKPDVCLINRYGPGAKLSMHQDKDEANLLAPIVSVSLGVPAVFALGGLSRNDPVQRLGLMHGDVLVLGGPSRLRYHAVLPLKHAHHPATGPHRINLTFRQALH